MGNVLVFSAIITFGQVTEKAWISFNEKIPSFKTQFACLRAGTTNQLVLVRPYEQGASLLEIADIVGSGSGYTGRINGCILLD